MQASTGKYSDVWEVNALLRKNGIPINVVESVQFDAEDNLLVNLRGKRAEEVKELLESHEGWDSPYADKPWD